MTARSPAHVALGLIRDEHRVLEAMLRTLPMLVARRARDGDAPHFPLLRAMVCYIAEYPERLHHPKEDALLFPAVRQARPDLGPVLDQLREEHVRGDALLAGLERSLTAWEVLGDSRRPAFEQQLAAYVDFYLSHMQREEREVLPAAREALDDAQWDLLARALSQSRDPLASGTPTEEFRALFDAILDALPDPLGHGRAA